MISNEPGNEEANKGTNEERRRKSIVFFLTYTLIVTKFFFFEIINSPGYYSYDFIHYFNVKLFTHVFDIIVYTERIAP